MKITKWNGKPITKPGWYSDIPIERYHSAGLCDGPSVSSSNLRTFYRKSAAHMFAEWCENPAAEPREATRAMILGGAAHHLLLGEDDFRLKYIARPETYRDKVTATEKPWNGNATHCRVWLDKQREFGRTVVTVAELKAIVAMSASLALEPLVTDGMLRGVVECTGIFKDKETGLWLKIRPDVVPPTGADYVDLKTAADVTTPALQSSIRSYGYHQQGALVWEVVEQLGQPFKEFWLMFIETVRPYCARAVPLTEPDLARGRQQNRVLLHKIASCIEAKHWPGPGEGDLRALSLSNDERTRIDEWLKHEGMS